jgi:hypothetical protein
LARDYAKGAVTLEKKIEEDEKNIKRGENFQQQLQDMYSSLLTVKPADLREDPANHPHLRDENTFPTAQGQPIRATIVSRLYRLLE